MPTPLTLETALASLFPSSTPAEREAVAATARDCRRRLEQLEAHFLRLEKVRHERVLSIAVLPQEDLCHS